VLRAASVFVDEFTSWLMFVLVVLRAASTLEEELERLKEEV
jgi:hypothetical protein